MCVDITGTYSSILLWEEEDSLLCGYHLFHLSDMEGELQPTSPFILGGRRAYHPLEDYSQLCVFYLFLLGPNFYQTISAAFAFALHTRARICIVRARGTRASSKYR